MTKFINKYTHVKGTYSILLQEACGQTSAETNDLGDGGLELSSQESDMIRFAVSKATRGSRLLLLDSQSNESGKRKIRGCSSRVALLGWEQLPRSLAKSHSQAEKGQEAGCISVGSRSKQKKQ